MAKFTLTITDADNGEVEMEASCNPPTNGPVEFDSLTPAQQYASVLLEYLKTLDKGKPAKKGKGKSRGKA